MYHGGAGGGRLPVAGAQSTRPLRQRLAKSRRERTEDCRLHCDPPQPAVERRRWLDDTGCARRCRIRRSSTLGALAPARASEHAVATPGLPPLVPARLLLRVQEAMKSFTNVKTFSLPSF